MRQVSDAFNALRLIPTKASGAIVLKYLSAAPIGCRERRLRQPTNEMEAAPVVCVGAKAQQQAAASLTFAPTNVMNFLSATTH